MQIIPPEKAYRSYMSNYKTTLNGGKRRISKNPIYTGKRMLAGIYINSLIKAEKLIRQENKLLILESK